VLRGLTPRDLRLTLGRSRGDGIRGQGDEASSASSRQAIKEEHQTARGVNLLLWRSN